MRSYKTVESFIDALHERVYDLTYEGPALTDAQQVQIATELNSPDSRAYRIVINGSPITSEAACDLFVSAIETSTRLEVMRIDVPETYQQVISALLREKVDTSISEWIDALRSYRPKLTAVGVTAEQVVMNVARISRAVNHLLSADLADPTLLTLFRAEVEKLKAILHTCGGANVVFIMGEIPDDVVELLAQVIVRSPTLAEVMLSDTQLNDSHIERLGQVLRQSAYLKEVDLSKNDFTSLGLKSIADFVAHCPLLEKLTLTDNPSLGDLTPLVAVLRRNKNFRDLRVLGVKLSQESLAALASFGKQVTVLCNRMSELANYVDEEVYGKHLASIRQLQAEISSHPRNRNSVQPVTVATKATYTQLVERYFQIEDAIIQDGDAGKISQIKIMRLTQLLPLLGRELTREFTFTTLDFRGCQLASPHWSQLVHLITQGRQQPGLNFANSNISGEGLIALARLFTQCDFISTIDFSGVPLGSYKTLIRQRNPVMSILCALCDQSLSSLVLNDTQLDDEHVQILTTLIAGNTALRYVDLRQNQFTVAGLTHLAKSVLCSQSLLRIQISDTAQLSFYSVVNESIVNNVFAALKCLHSDVLRVTQQTLEALEGEYQELETIVGDFTTHGVNAISIDICSAELAEISLLLEAFAIQMSLGEDLAVIATSSLKLSDYAPIPSPPELPVVDLSKIHDTLDALANIASSEATRAREKADSPIRGTLFDYKPARADARMIAAAFVDLQRLLSRSPQYEGDFIKHWLCNSPALNQFIAQGLAASLSPTPITTVTHLVDALIALEIKERHHSIPDTGIALGGVA